MKGRARGWVPPAHGTNAAYALHWRWRVAPWPWPACPACRKAHSDYTTANRKAPQ